MENKIIVENREELIYLLTQAAELEHGLLCSYLFASFSLKSEVSEGLSEEESAATSRWKRSIRKIAEQEMLHLSLANNLLTAIGAAPHFTRPNLPQPSSYYPAEISLALTPFSKQTLDHFIFIERPRHLTLKDGAGFSAKQSEKTELKEESPLQLQADEDLISEPIIPVDQPFTTVDQLYEGIKKGFQHLSEKYGEARLFIGPDAAQATEQYFEFTGLTRVTDLASAEKAIELIVSQGEGSEEDYEESHFGIFSAIKEEYNRLKKQNKDFEPARPVVENPYTRPLQEVNHTNLIDEPFTVQISNLFNASYEVMTQMLIRFFAHSGENKEELSLLIKTAVDMMKFIIKPLGDLLTRLPAGAAFPDQTAGPNFQFFRSIHLLPHKKAAWLIFEERLNELKEYCENLEIPKVVEYYRPELLKVQEGMTQLVGRFQIH